MLSFKCKITGWSSPRQCQFNDETLIFEACTCYPCAVCLQREKHMMDGLILRGLDDPAAGIEKKEESDRRLVFSFPMDIVYGVSGVEDDGGGVDIPDACCRFLAQILGTGVDVFDGNQGAADIPFFASKDGLISSGCCVIRHTDTFKYIVGTIDFNSDKSKDKKKSSFFLWSAPCGFHAELAGQVSRAFKGHEVYVHGGGYLKISTVSKMIDIYGASVRFGRPPNMDIVKSLASLPPYDDYTVSIDEIDDFW